MGLRRQVKRLLNIKGSEWRPEFLGDNLAVRNRNLSFLNDPAFQDAYDKALEANAAVKKPIPDIRFRMHTAIWAARHALSVPGDFVECGVFMGFLATGICRVLNFSAVPKKFYLCDTFRGIPEDSASTPEEAAHIAKSNERYFDCYEITKKNFAAYPNVELVRGMLPQSLDSLSIDRIAYLSIDLNNAKAEEGCIRKLWPILSPGAVVLLDDYGFAGFDEQHRFWNDFAGEHGTSVLTNPSGQGVLLKPPASRAVSS